MDNKHRDGSKLSALFDGELEGVPADDLRALVASREPEVVRDMQWFRTIGEGVSQWHADETASGSEPINIWTAIEGDVRRLSRGKAWRAQMREQMSEVKESIVSIFSPRFAIVPALGMAAVLLVVGRVPQEPEVSQVAEVAPVPQLASNEREIAPGLILQFENSDRLGAAFYASADEDDDGIRRVGYDSSPELRLQVPAPRWMGRQSLRQASLWSGDDFDRLQTDKSLNIVPARAQGLPPVIWVAQRR